MVTGAAAGSGLLHLFSLAFWCAWLGILVALALGDCMGAGGGLLHVQFVQLGVHPVQASRLGPLLACSGVQLGLCPSSVYLALWMLIFAY